MEHHLGDLPLWRDGQARQILQGLCAKHRVSQDVLIDLVRIEREFLGSGRPHGINDQITEALDNME